VIGASANPFQIVNLREKQKHLSLFETFYKLFYWIKKNRQPTIIMDYIVLVFGWSVHLQTLFKSLPIPRH